MSTDQEENLVSLAKQVLDEQVLDADISERLSMARRAAVAEMDRPSLSLQNRWLQGAVAATLVVSVGLWSLRTPLPVLPIYNGEDAQMAAENMDLLADMEFVAWLAEEEEMNAG